MRHIIAQKYLGEFNLSDEVICYFSHFDSNGGAGEVTNAGTVSVYKNDSNTETTVGITREYYVNGYG